MNAGLVGYFLFLFRFNLNAGFLQFIIQCQAVFFLFFDPLLFLLEFQFRLGTLFVVPFLP